MPDDIRREKIPTPAEIVAAYDTYGPRARYPVLAYLTSPYRSPVTPLEVHERDITEAAVETLRRQNERRRADEWLAESLMDEIAFAAQRAENEAGFRLMVQHACARAYNRIMDRRRERVENGLEPAP